MAVDDLVQIVPIDVGVPDVVRIDHDDRAGFATPHAAGLVDPDLPVTVYAKRLQALLDVVARLVGAVVLAALFYYIVSTSRSAELSYIPFRGSTGGGHGLGQPNLGIHARTLSPDAVSHVVSLR